jgi:MFS family permease
VSPTFRSLSVPNYRLWASGAIVSNVGTWMQRIAQDWLVLTQLTHDSGVALGITSALQFAPILLLLPLTGSVADRFNRRKVLMITQTVSALLALSLGILVITDAVQLWHVYVFAALLGCVGAVDGPSRQSFVSELVPADSLTNAVSLNSASFHAARLIGPGLAGVLIHLIGTGPVFMLNSFTFVAVLFSLSRIDVGELNDAPRMKRGTATMRDGLSYVRSRPDITLVLLVVGLVGSFTMNAPVTTGLMARQVFDQDAGGFGLLTSITAIGSLMGALIGARVERPRLRYLIGAAAALAVASAVAAVMPTYELFAAALVPVGICTLMLMTSANSTVQLAAAPHMRGRVMALYMAVFMGGTAIGGPIVGWIGEEVGARAAILVGAIVSMLAAMIALAWTLHRQRARLPPVAETGALSPDRSRDDAAAVR